MGAGLVGAPSGTGTSLALQGAGTLTSAYGSYTEGLAKQSYYRYLATKNRQQEAVVQSQADQESQLATNQGMQKSEMVSRRASEIEGSQAAAAGANGTAGSTTQANITTDTFNKAKMDELAVKYNADVQSWRAQQTARNEKYALENEATGEDIAGNAAKVGGRMGAINSILSGARGMSDTWFKAQFYKKNKSIPSDMV